MKWFKKGLYSLSDYKSSFKFENTEIKDSKKTKLDNAYEKAADIRKFEIDKYWSRTGYFWAFIVSIYTAYFAVLTQMYREEYAGYLIFSHGKIPLLVLSALGLFFSFSWFLANKASRHWQENWETHMDLLEDDVTGPLYKTFLSDASYSVSAINILASKVITFCAYFLLQFEFVFFAKDILLKNCYDDKTIVLFMFVLGFAFFSLFALYVVARNVRGNVKDYGEIKFVQKNYKD